MEKRNTPRIGGALPLTPTIKVYSDNRKLTTQELFLLDYVLSNPENQYESKEIKKVRAQVKSARLAVDHFNQEKLNPILPALEFEAIRKGA
jgi:hypothetical protein